MVLKYNTFKYFDNCCGKIEGGAMGNPFTCMWAVTHVAVLEILTCGSLFKKLLLLLVSFIDDVFLV